VFRLYDTRTRQVEAIEPRPGGGQMLRMYTRQRLDARQAARAARDWATADRLRGELAANGVSVSDTADGQEWTVRPVG
jgi:hypothetical protein